VLRQSRCDGSAAGRAARRDHRIWLVRPDAAGLLRRTVPPRPGAANHLRRRDAPLAAYPDFHVAALITESRSTNTAENIAFTAALLAREHPALAFDRETEIHAAQGIDFTAHPCGELDRIVDHPRRGWIESEPLPPEIAAAHAVLKATGGA